jgi:hypothetical protein
MPCFIMMLSRSFKLLATESAACRVNEYSVTSKFRNRSTSRRSCATELRHCSALKALVHTQARSRHAHSQLSQFSHSILFLDAPAKARRHNKKKGDARKRGRKQKLVLVNPSKWIDKRPTPDVSPT